MKKRKKLRTKSQIKVDRLLSLLIGSMGLLGIGYYTAMGNPLKLMISIVAMFWLLRVDKCNNDLEYGKYKKEKERK